MIDNAVMLDVETMGTGSTSAILSIGAVKFDADGLRDSIYLPIDLQTCLDVGMTVDGDTVSWWMNQSREARQALMVPNNSIQCALNQFADWLGECDSIWGNGANFDNVILANAYRMCHIHQPWKYSADRCYRTVKNMCKNVALERFGMHHNSLDDAKTQALHLIECLKSLGLAIASEDEVGKTTKAYGLIQSLKGWVRE